MPYASTDFYLNEFKGKNGGDLEKLLSLLEFASEKIDAVTICRIGPFISSFQEDCVKRACCHQADYYFEACKNACEFPGIMGVGGPGESLAGAVKGFRAMEFSLELNDMRPQPAVSHGLSERALMFLTKAGLLRRAL